jgi:hypothetical protein
MATASGIRPPLRFRRSAQICSLIPGRQAQYALRFGTYGLNIGLCKVFLFHERIRTEIGADVNNILNQSLKSPETMTSAYWVTSA